MKYIKGLELIATDCLDLMKDYYNGSNHNYYIRYIFIVKAIRRLCIVYC